MKTLEQKHTINPRIKCTCIIDLETIVQPGYYVDKLYVCLIGFDPNQYTATSYRRTMNVTSVTTKKLIWYLPTEHSDNRLINI